jgi:hypothetical protein
VRGVVVICTSDRGRRFHEDRYHGSPTGATLRVGRSSAGFQVAVFSSAEEFLASDALRMTA